MFGLVGASAGSGTVSCYVFWNNNCSGHFNASAWTGVLQTSVAAAFTNPTHANATSAGPAAVTIPSAANNVAVAQFGASIGAMDSVNDAAIYLPLPRRMRRPVTLQGLPASRLTFLF